MVDVGKCECVFKAAFNLAVVCEEGLERRVNFHRLPGEADVECGEAAQVFEVA